MKYNSKKYKLENKLRCTAITNAGDRCSIIVDETPDNQILCHIHHPNRTFQKQLQENRELLQSKSI